MDTSNSANAGSMDDLRLKRNKAGHSSQHSLSLGMEEALYQPHSHIQPKPLVSRVKQAGKEFLRHNQTCHWIEFMREPTELPERMPKATQVRPEEASEIKDVVRKMVPREKEDEDSEAENEDDMTLRALDEENGGVLSFQAQLRELHKQQEELLEQQRFLEERLEQQKKVHQFQTTAEQVSAGGKWAQSLPVSTPPPTPAAKLGDVKIAPALPSAAQSNSRWEEKERNKMAPPDSGFRRRLKGQVAQSYAQRDEGTIGNLLYNNRQEPPTERRSNLSTAKNVGPPLVPVARTSVERRQYGLSQDSGSNISQLLSEPPSNNWLNVRASDSSSVSHSETLTDLSSKTVTVQKTIRS